MSDSQNEFDLFPTRPDEGAASSDEVFKCRNCGSMYPTEGKSEGTCPVCGHTCTRDSCMVTFASNEGY